ncbi:MAG: polysaccharide biosynthesis tyrosine autokinase [Planctomycetota bacterium]
MDNINQPSANMMRGPSGRPPMRPPQRPRPPMGPAAGGMAMTPKEIVGILRQHIWMIIIFTVVGTIIGGGSWYLCNRYIPKYTSVGAFNVDMPTTQNPLEINTLQVAKDIYYQFRLTKASLIKQDYMLRELLDTSEKVKGTVWFKKFAKVDTEGNIVGDRAKAFDKAFKDLKDNLSASAPRDNNYVLVSMKCAAAKDAKLIVDEMMYIFLSKQRDLAKAGLTDELTKFTEQQGEIQKTLDVIEGTLLSIRSGTPYARLNLGENQAFRDYMDDRLQRLENQRSTLDTTKSGLESEIATLKARASAADFDNRVQEQVENDPIARQMRSTIAVLETELDRRRDRFGEDHRLVRETQVAVNQKWDAYAKRQRKIGDILRESDLMRAEERKAVLFEQLATATTQLAEAHTQYKEIDEERTNYTRFDQKRLENEDYLEEMNKAIKTKKAQINDPKLSKLSPLYSGTMPINKSFPNPLMFFPGGFILGMFAGLGLAFLIELMNDLLRTPSDVMRHLKVPLMGMICHIDDDEDVEGVDLYHVVRQAPYSIMSECYRQLRTNLKLSGSGSSAKKTLLVTSGQAGDGKTTVAVNLAATLLAEDRRVLLIDANFRRPSANRLFPHSQANGTPVESSEFGLSNYLMGQCDGTDQVVRDSGIEGLSIIDSGPLPANPAELFSGERMKSLLEYCKSNFDHVIIDGPATLVSDSKTLAAQADGTMIIFNTSKTHRGEAIRILREMREVHADVIGTVLLGVKSRKGGYFHEKNRAYQEYQRVQVEQLV